jgi:hypothetical protein
VHAAQIAGVAGVAATPGAGADSSSSTRLPASRAIRAAHSAALPPPMTSTSVSKASVFMMGCQGGPAAVQRGESLVHGRRRSAGNRAAKC